MSTWIRKEDLEKIGASFLNSINHLGEEAFVKRFFEIYQLIEETKTHIARIFGENAKTELCMSEDPECGFHELYLTILTERGVTESRKLLRQFDDEFWLENMQRASGLFSVSMEYV